MNDRSRQSGFVLLMALVLVLLAGVTLAAVARRSMVGALESETAADALKRRWAVRSCRRTLLGEAERILDEAERGAAEPEAAGGDVVKGGATGRGGEMPSRSYANDPIRELRARFELAGIDYELVLTDEQAKLNVNALLARADRAETQAVVSSLLAGISVQPGPPPTVRLRTLAGREQALEQRGLRLKAGGYGQVFEDASPQRLLGDGRGSGLASRITLWGDGRVNLRRAPAVVVRQACRGKLAPGIVRALLEARRADPYRDLDAMLSESDVLAEIDRETRAEIADHVTTRSTCHGMWLIARGEQRSWHTLAVGVRGAEPDSMQRREFIW